MVSVLPLVDVTVKSVLNRYVPLSSPLLVFDIDKLLLFTVFDQLAPSTSFQIHKPQCFSMVCVAVMDFSVFPAAVLLQVALAPTIAKIEVRSQSFSYSGTTEPLT